METLWFALAALVAAIYVVMDGFDFGAGALHLGVAKNDMERRTVLAAIGPYWDGNEVWLLATGGVLFLAFPAVLASGLSGFYFAVTFLLWVIILRGIAIEFRSHVKEVLWRSFWDACFTLASVSAPVFLGTALGNLIRGVPVGQDGWFALALFESFSPSGELGLFDWYTLTAGVLALAALLHHGALFLAWKTGGLVQERSLKVAGRLFWPLVLLWVVATAATAYVAPEIFSTLAERPLAWICAGLPIAGLALSFAARKAGKERWSFLGSSAFLFGLLLVTAASMYPTMIRSIDTPALSLTAHNSAASPQSLRTGLYWWPVGFVLAMIYFVVLFRLHRGKAQVTEGGGY